MRTLIFNPATGESHWEEDPPKRADLVAVVRCKDCKCYVVYNVFGREVGWCERLCLPLDRSGARLENPDDFCSHGKRREDDSD